MNSGSAKPLVPRSGRYLPKGRYCRRTLPLYVLLTSSLHVTPGQESLHGLTATEAFHAVPLGGVLWSLVEQYRKTFMTKKASSHHLLDYLVAYLIDEYLVLQIRIVR